MNQQKWDNRFVELANVVASWSKDRSTKVGAVVASPDNRIISMGYNGFTEGMDDELDCLHARPIKYDYTEHAERNAIYQAAKYGHSLNGCSMFLNWFPCADCARAIVQAGIRRLVCVKPDLSNPQWGSSFTASIRILEAANVSIVYV